jgi:phage terminase small subunit
MANEKREQARQMWEQSGGTMPLKEIAGKLGVSLGTVKSWKHRDAWGIDPGLRRLQKVATHDAIAEKRRRRAAQSNRRAAEHIEKNTELNEAEKAFCLAAISHPSGASAAMATGRYATYRSAKSAAWDMMQNPAVRAEIDRLKAIKHQQLLADGDDVLDWYARAAFADMAQFTEFGEREEPLVGEFGPVMREDPDTGEQVPVMVRRSYLRLLDSDAVDGQLVSEIRVGPNGTTFKLVDRFKAQKALERLRELDPMDRHKVEFDRKKLEYEAKRLALEERKAAEGNEDALAKLDDIMGGVNMGMNDGSN